MGAQSEEIRTERDSPNTGVFRFRADDCILSALWQVRDRNLPARITHQESGSIWLHPAERIGAVSTRHPERLFTAIESDLAIEWQAKRPEKQICRPAEDIFWQAAWYGSRGALLESCNPYDVIRMKQWPNFTRLPFHNAELTLCALFYQRSSSLSFAYRSLKIKREDAFRFYSAARAAGLVHVVSAQPGQNGAHLPPSEATGGREPEAGPITFWKSLVKKLSGL